MAISTDTTSRRRGRDSAQPRRPRATRAGLAPYLFVAPVVTLFLVFLALPIAYSVYLSLRTVKVSGLGLGGKSRTEVWAGLDNYRDAVTDAELWRAGGRVLLYGGILLPIMLGLALLFALLLDSASARLTRFARISIFLPYAVPGVIATLLWGFLYLPSVSPFTYVLQRLSLPQPDILGPVGIYGALINIAVWGGVGFNMVVLYTSLRAIPMDLYEAARLDGCSELQIALRIKIPLIAPSMVLTTVFSLIATLQVFSEPATLRPLSNSLSSTWTPLMKVYRDAFTLGDLNSAAATSVVLTLVTFVVSFGFLRVVQSRAFGEDRPRQRADAGRVTS